VFRPLDRDAPAERGEGVGVFADADAQPVRGAGAFARVIISVMLRGPQGFNELLASAPGLSDRFVTRHINWLWRDVGDIETSAFLIAGSARIAFI